MKNYFNKFLEPALRKIFYTYTIIIIFIFLLYSFSINLPIDRKILIAPYIIFALILSPPVLIPSFINFTHKIKNKIHPQFNNIKNFMFEKIKKIFYLLSFLNLFLHLFAFFIILFVVYGSPMSLNDRIVNFKQEEEVKLTKEPINQKFIAKSNNLGSVGLIFRTDDFQKTEEQDSLKILFRIKEDGKEKYFYENVYDFHKSSNNESFLFGFPIQNDSKDKTYVFEMSSLNNNEAKINLYLGKNIDSKINYFPRYVYSIRSLRSSAMDVISNSLFKIKMSLTNKNIVFYLLINSIAIEFALISLLLINKKSAYKRQIYLSNLIIFLFSNFFMVFGNLSKFSNIEDKKYLLFLIAFYTGLIIILKARLFIKNLNKNTVGKEKKSFLILAILSLIFLSTRFNMTKIGLWQDESFQIFAAEGILKSGLPKISNVVVNNIIYTRGITQTYLIALFFSIFGKSDFIARIPTLIFSLISMIVFFSIFKKIYGNKIALLSSIILIFWSWTIFFASWSRFYVFIASFSVILGYFLIKYEETKKEQYLFLSLATILLASLTNQSGAMLSVCLLPFIMDILKNKKIVLISILSGLSILIFIAKKDSMSQSEIFKSNVLREFFLIDINLNFPNWIFKWFPLIMLSNLLYSISTFFKKEEKFIKTKKSFSYFFIAYLLFLVIFKVPSAQPRIIIPIAYVLLIQTIFFYQDILETINNIFKLNKKNLLVIQIIIFSFILVSLNPKDSYFAIFPKYEKSLPDYLRFSFSERFLPDYRSAAIFVKKNAKNEDFIIIDGEAQYLYLEDNVDLFLNKNKKTSIEDLKKIQESNDKVWVVSGYMQPGQHTSLDYDYIYKYLEENAKIAFEGNFPSKVYLLEKQK